MTFFYIVLLKDKLLYVVLSALINFNLQARFSPPLVFEKVLLEHGHNNLIIVDGCFGPASGRAETWLWESCSQNQKYLLSTPLQKIIANRIAGLNIYINI